MASHFESMSREEGIYQWALAHAQATGKPQPKFLVDAERVFAAPEPQHTSALKTRYRKFARSTSTLPLGVKSSSTDKLPITTHHAGSTTQLPLGQSHAANSDSSIASSSRSRSSRSTRSPPTASASAQLAYGRNYSPRPNASYDGAISESDESSEDDSYAPRAPRSQYLAVPPQYPEANPSRSKSPRKRDYLNLLAYRF